MKKLPILLLALGAVLILVLLVFWLWPKPVAQAPAVTTVEGLTVTAPVAGQAISSPLLISGLVNGQGWTGFEGQVGTVRLVDGSGKELGLAILTATTEWTQLPTQFKTSLEFTPPAGGGNGFLVFRNENASGEPERDREYKLPITFK